METIPKIRLGQVWEIKPEYYGTRTDKLNGTRILIHTRTLNKNRFLAINLTIDKRYVIYRDELLKMYDLIEEPQVIAIKGLNINGHIYSLFTDPTNGWIGLTNYLGDCYATASI